jgi:hypothetical protein
MEANMTCEICNNEGEIFNYIISLPMLDLANGEYYIRNFSEVCHECLDKLAVINMVEIEKIQGGLHEV